MNEEQELITVRLSREDYEVLRQEINERKAYNVITNKLKSLWIWAFAGGVMTLLAFWDTLKEIFTKG